LEGLLPASHGREEREREREKKDGDEEDDDDNDAVDAGVWS